MPEGLTDYSLHAIPHHCFRDILLGYDKTEARKGNIAIHSQHQNVLAGDLVAGILEYGLVIRSTQQTQLLAKAKVRHRFYFRECCKREGKPITLSVWRDHMHDVS